jgi:Asp-tRNA(Asn)/Glu-tRNA(Gln) amidotransferase A subunit family amidase
MYGLRRRTPIHTDNGISSHYQQAEHSRRARVVKRNLSSSFAFVIDIFLFPSAKDVPVPYRPLVAAKLSLLLIKISSKGSSKGPAKMAIDVSTLSKEFLLNIIDC